MNHPFYPLLFGGDINVYSVARAFHEAYGVKSTCYGKYPSGPAWDSALILIPPIACGVIAVACLFIAAVYLKKFLAARSVYRAAQLPLTSPAGRECAKLREYAELVQSVIDDFQKA